MFAGSSSENAVPGFFLKCRNFSLTSNVLDWPFVSDEQFGLDVLEAPLSSVVFPRDCFVLSQ